jgi:hypothetical protein
LLAFLSVLGVLFGGVWFLWRRMAQPRLVLAHDVTHEQLDTERILLRVRLTADNKGEVAVKPGHCRIWVQQVIPWADDFMGEIPSRGSRTWEGSPEFSWPIIGESILSSKRLADYQIEPHETEEFPVDFVLSTGLQCVQVYTHLMQRPRGKWWWCLLGESRRFRELKRLVSRMRRTGWNRTSLYRLAAGRTKGA